MPSKATLKRARTKKRKGESPGSQAGEFIREEIHHVREGKHGARSAKQVIAIGLSKARRAGVKLPPPKKGTVSEETRENAKRAYEAGQEKHEPSPKRSRATREHLEHEGKAAATTKSLSQHARAVARKRTAAARSASAKKAAETKGAAGRREAARKAARTRARHQKSKAA